MKFLLLIPFASIALISCNKRPIESELIIGTWTHHEASNDHRFERNVTAEIKNDHTCIFTSRTKLDSKENLRVQKGTWTLSGNNLIIHSISPNDPNQSMDFRSRINSLDKQKLTITVEPIPEIAMPLQTLVYTKTEQDAAANP